ncbi:GMC oxidoreductase [Spongiactinospora sp. TRM90649]|uniref:GMC family oxidoreductase n=1 Tax=Spongiactinospora sp. TRM90649 TaxID=3031114 RepID=UPI0023F813B0|nr:GMC oxidoreductase [Spongiactinospora sp. TRM90649]MDF5751646.1 GMC family oxidoreductase N-terminal domain-containing protein [Spongiactinospora sp. TRM90649]
MATGGFDYLVLGGGVAGCVLAGRLTERNGLRVGLVEGGPDHGPGREGWPGGLRDARLLPRDEVWDGDGPPYRLRGKVLGGSSSVNGCWHTWGAPGDFAEWAALGGPHLCAGALEPYRLRAVRAMGLREVPDGELTAWATASLAAAAELGYPEIADMAALGPPRGAGRPPINAAGHERVNAAQAYLRRDRPGLEIMAGALADRLVIERGRVTGVRVIRGGVAETLRAERYLLTAGTYGSPGVLLRSGVGPADDLRRLGIEVALDLPAVGANLIDHPSRTLRLAPSPGLTAALRAQEEADGLYPSQVAIKAGSAACPPGTWDLHLLPIAGAPLFGTLPPGHYEVGVTAFLMKPRSRGRVSIPSADPAAPPIIEPGFLTDPGGHDRTALGDGLRLAGELAATGPLRTRASPAGPPSAAVGTYWHPVGTCAMGPGDSRDAVVDGHGKVHGLSGLWIADASIMPSIPRCNTQLPTLALAELLAEAFLGQRTSPGA